MGLTAALLITVVYAVIGAVTHSPLRYTAIVRLAGELCIGITLMIWAHYKKQKMKCQTFKILP